ARHPQLPEFKFVPQVGHKPLQSIVHNAFIGTANRICSRTMSAIASFVPVKNAVRVSFSSNSTSSSSSNIDSSRSRKNRSNGLVTCIGAGSRHREQGNSTVVANLPLIRISAPARSTEADQSRFSIWRMFSDPRSITPGSKRELNESFSWAKSLRSIKYLF